MVPPLQPAEGFTPTNWREGHNLCVHPYFDHPCAMQFLEDMRSVLQSLQPAGVPLAALRQLFWQEHGMDATQLSRPLAAFLAVYTVQENGRLFCNSPTYARLLEVRCGCIARGLGAL